jgi:hypothetical protein
MNFHWWLQELHWEGSQHTDEAAFILGLATLPWERSAFDFTGTPSPRLRAARELVGKRRLPWSQLGQRRRLSHTEGRQEEDMSYTSFKSPTCAWKWPGQHLESAHRGTSSHRTWPLPLPVEETKLTPKRCNMRPTGKDHHILSSCPRLPTTSDLSWGTVTIST